MFTGQPGALALLDNEVVMAVTGDVGPDGIEALYLVRNPDKLAHITVPRS